jgi:hypothetical protein
VGHGPLSAWPQPTIVLRALIKKPPWRQQALAAAKSALLCARRQPQFDAHHHLARRRNRLAYSFTTFSPDTFGDQQN